MQLTSALYLALLGMTLAIPTNKFQNSGGYDLAYEKRSDYDAANKAPADYGPADYKRSDADYKEPADYKRSDADYKAPADY